MMAETKSLMETEEKDPKTEEERDAMEEIGDEDEESSDDDDDDDDEEEEDAEREQRIVELEKQIRANPYLYNSHVDLIKLLREIGDLGHLRKARQYMSEIFPLTEELWLDWLRDEMPLVSSDSERQNVEDLFERAVKDYQSVDVWLEYVQYTIGGMTVENGVTQVREMFEKSVAAVGLHVSKGTSIWEAYREFENAILSGLMPHPGSMATKEQEEGFKAQHQRIVALFKRQLSVPLLDMEETFEEFKEWQGGELERNTRQVYEKALAKLEEIKLYEDALLNAEAPRLVEYQTYIEYELSKGDPARIQCVYERAIQENCLHSSLWLQYTKYLETTLRVKSVSLSVYERAVRNCPWCSQIWQEYLLSLERHEEPHEKVKETMEQALNSGFTQSSEFLQLWTVYCDYLRRRIKWNEDHSEQLEDFRATIERAIEHLEQYFGREGDITCSLRQYWALIEAKFCKNQEKARDLWNEIMAQGHGTEGQMWLSYYRLERAYGSNKHCRKILQRALNSVSDWPESIVDVCVQFEREEGTLEQYDHAVSRCEAQMQRINERRTKAEEKKQEQKVQKTTHRKVAQKFQGSDQTSAHWATQDSNSTLETAKRKLEIEDNLNVHTDKDGFKIPPLPATGAKAAISPEEPAMKKMRTEEPSLLSMDPNSDRTVFVSNLSYGLGEEQIEEIFNNCGEITEVRLVQNYKGKSKGYAYVEFQNTASVAAALRLDREPVDGRPMFVSPCEERASSKQAQFRYSTALEKNKLFVKGLPYTCTKEAVQTIFGEHGHLKDVRLVTYKNGAFKGLAYVEFENEADAAKAVLKTDGLMVGEQVISVAISNPPGRKTPVSKRNETSALVQSLGGGKKESEQRGKARTMVRLLPRAVEHTRRSTGGTAPPLKTSTNGSAEETSTSQKTTKGMSNEDFRQMLLKR